MSSDVRCTSRTRGSLDPDITVSIELVVPDEFVPDVLKAIQTHRQTGRHGDGRHGDGRMFVVDVQSTIRIASGERKDT